MPRALDWGGAGAGWRKREEASKRASICLASVGWPSVRHASVCSSRSLSGSRTDGVKAGAAAGPYSSSSGSIGSSIKGLRINRPRHRSIDRSIDPRISNDRSIERASEEATHTVVVLVRAVVPSAVARLFAPLRLSPRLSSATELARGGRAVLRHAEAGPARPTSIASMPGKNSPRPKPLIKCEGVCSPGRSVGGERASRERLPSAAAAAACMGGRRSGGTGPPTSARRQRARTNT